MTNKFFFFLLISFFSLNAGCAQKINTSVVDNSKSKIDLAMPTDLYKEIFKADSILFHASNNCDSLTYQKFWSDDLEFYHDIGGLAVGTAIEFQSFREMCARGSNIRRELVKGSLEVYPIKNYGAIEIGVHRFYHTNKGQQEKLSGTYKFIQIWQKKEGQWKITRVISYGHDNMKND